LAVGAFAKEGMAQASPPASKQQGNLRQSVCKWCFRTLSVEELARGVAAIGMKSVELVPPEDWPTLKKYGLTCAMASYGDALRNPQIRAGLNRPENHDAWEQYFRRFIDAAADAGVPNVICFSGWREGMSDEEGVENCAIGLKRVIGQAEKRGVTLCMELLNSKLEGKPGEYMCDHTAWGVKLVKRVASPRFKLLYDIYHMQIMEGDVIRTIDETQELNYHAIAKALADKNYTGYLAQEFLPLKDPLVSLGQAFRICDV
jgi:hydroxypyruvate isomerase